MILRRPARGTMSTTVLFINNTRYVAYYEWLIDVTYTRKCIAFIARVASEREG